MADGSICIDTAIDSSVLEKGLERAEKKLARAESRLDNLIEKERRFIETGGNTDSKTFAGMEYDIEQAKRSVESAKTVVETIKTQLEEVGTKAQHLQEISTNAEISRQDIIDLANELSVLKTRQEELQQAGIGLGYAEYDTNTTRISQINQQLAAYRATLTEVRVEEAQTTSGTEMLRNMVDGLKNAFIHLGQSILSAVKKLPKTVSGAVIGGFKKLGIAAKNAAKKILGIGKNSQSSNRSMMKMIGTSLLMGMAFKAVMAIMNGLKEGMNNLAQYSGETNSDLSALKSSLTQLNNSFATAFAPILSVVTPILTGFMNTISKVVTHIGMLMAALTGKGTFTKAVEVQEDYAAGLSNSADAAKDASKAQQDYTTGLDEINRASSNESSSGSSGTSSSATPSQMFEEVSIGESISDLASTLKQKVADGDWKGVGSLVAEKVNSIFSKIDTRQLASNLSEKVINALNVVSGFLQDIDWQMLGNKVAHFVAGINWSGLTKALFEGIGSALGALAGFVWGIIEDAWKSVVDWWYENAYEDGDFTMQGLLEGIWDGICNIGTWIKENIFTPFINGFKEAFGINSTSTVMREMGGYLMAGVTNGISSGITGVVNMFSNLKQRIVDIWNSIVNKIKGCVNSIIGAINGLIRGVVSGMNSVVRALNKLSFDVPDWVPGIGGKTFGFNLKTVTAPQIPYLATGAVIPPNAPFLAMLGDQKHGTNIEAPLDTIKQAVAEVIGNTRGGGGTYTFIGQINRRTLFEEVISEAKAQQLNTGLNPFELA